MARRCSMVVMVLLALASIAATARGAATSAALPRVPQMVTELYLPEEHEAYKSAYAIYADLDDGLRAKLHKGTKYPIAAAKLSPFTRTKLAAWFNSARWGCDPPAEKLDAEAVAKSTLLLTHSDGVVELALQSPEKGIWKKLTIACSPGKAEWVRDGLPLVPAWVPVPWEGGLRPPEPSPVPGYVGAWQTMRPLYRAYAELSASDLRELHAKHELRLVFSALRPDQQRALAEAEDEDRLRTNKAFGLRLEYGRTPELQRRRFGITEVVISYARSHADCGSSWPLGIGALDIYPRPYRVIFVQLDPLHHKSDSDLALVRRDRAYLVAMPVEVQRKVLAWQRDGHAWLRKWQYRQGGRTYNKPGAPPYPFDPWGGTMPAG